MAAELLASPPALLLSSEKISASHRSRDAYVYVRQSTPSQVVAHTESLVRQYELCERAVALGWPAPQVVVIDADLGRSGADATARLGFRELVALVGLGQVGIVLGSVSELVLAGQVEELDVAGWRSTSAPIPERCNGPTIKSPFVVSGLRAVATLSSSGSWIVGGQPRALLTFLWVPGHEGRAFNREPCVPRWTEVLSVRQACFTSSRPESEKACRERSPDGDGRTDRPG